MTLANGILHQKECDISDMLAELYLGFFQLAGIYD